MTREEADFIGSMNMYDEISNEAYKKIVCYCEEQEPCGDIEEIREVMSCDADAETKCKMISNILTAEPHYFKKPCVDAISRQAVLDIDFNRIIHTTAKPAEMIRQKVEQLPPVTPKSETVTEFADRCRECGREKVLDEIRAKIPSNITNGDVLKKMFPNMHFNIIKDIVWTNLDGQTTRFCTDWWNAPYKADKENN